jgi:hypothetical protein
MFVLRRKARKHADVKAAMQPRLDWSGPRNARPNATRSATKARDGTHPRLRRSLVGDRRARPSSVTAIRPVYFPTCRPARRMHNVRAYVLRLLALCLVVLGLGACTSIRETAPQRTATEQLLISTAVDRAIAQVNLKIPPGTKVFVSADQLQDTSDGKYATGEMKERLLSKGAHLVDDKGKADAVVEVRAGALSIDDKQTLIGIDTFDAPVPFAGQAVKIPQIALYSDKVRQGVAKIAAFGYSTSDGTLIALTGPQFGYAHQYERTILFFFTWHSTDLPEEKSNALGID